MNKNLEGKIIVIEGIDGSGKSTQIDMLCDKLRYNGFPDVLKFKFPNYKSESSAAVRMYLDSKICKDLEDTNPYAVSLFYTVDRYIAMKTELSKWISEHPDGIIVLDRYIGSNIIHQCSRLNSRKEKINYVRWLTGLEYDIIGLPKEVTTVYLSIPPKLAIANVTKRCDELGVQRDIQEVNKDYIFGCAKIAEELEGILQNELNWKFVEVSELGNPKESTSGLILAEMRDRESISEDIYKQVTQKLKSSKARFGSTTRGALGCSRRSKSKV